MGYIGAGVTRFNTADELTVTGDAQIDTTTLVVDSTNNRVGVGTASPTTALDVTGTVTANQLDVDNITIDGNTISSTDTNGDITLDPDGTGDIVMTGPASATPVTNAVARVLTTGSNPPTGNGGGLVFTQVNSGGTNQDYASITGSRVDSTANNKVDLVISTGDPTGGTAIAERVRVDTAGNVGIGTTSPSELLHVDNASGDAAIRIDGSTRSFKIEQNNYGLRFVDVSGGSAERMRIAASGNVGIGTTSPDSKLTIANTTQWHDGLQIRRDSPSDQYLALGYDVGAAYIIAVDETPASAGDGQTTVFGYSSNGTSFTESMRIDSDGRMLIGDTTNVGTADHKLSIQKGTGGRCLGLGTTLTTASIKVSFVNGNGTVGTIQTSGTSTSYNTSSDHRLKENVADMTGAIDRVKALAPKRFNFIADADTTVDGFLAHEAQAVVPEAVTGTHNEVDDDGNPVMQGIDQSKLVPLLTGALQEAIAKIEDLETRLAALEGA